MMEPHQLSILTKIFYFVKKNKLLLIFSFLLISASFALGIIIGGQFFKRPPLIIDKDLILDLNQEEIFLNQKTEKGYVASLKGKYYYPIDCPLAKNLSEKNKIYFNSKEEAENNGYIYNNRCD